jgi:hypothetical protein
MVEINYSSAAFFVNNIGKPFFNVAHIRMSEDSARLIRLVGSLHGLSAF